MDKLKLIAGPCVIENEDLIYSIAERIKLVANKFNIDYFFKDAEFLQFDDQKKINGLS